MRVLLCAIGLVCVLCTVSGCRSSAPPTEDVSPPPSVPSSVAGVAEESGSGTPADAEALGDLLRRAHEEKSGWDTLELTAECRESDSPDLRSVLIYGSGVGIWGRRLQFGLQDEEIKELLGFLREADFLDLPELYGSGGSVGETEIKSSDSTEGGVRIICRVDLELGSYRKESAQRLKGDQSIELRALAERLLDYCEPLAVNCVGIEDLDSGLVKIASGELAAETLHVVLHRKPEPGVQSQGVGYRMIIDGPSLSLREFTAGQGYGDEKIVALDRSDISDLAKRLSDIGLGHLPANLYAEDYTDLRIKILDQRKAVQARRFAGMRPDKHGDAQRDFDRILAILDSFVNSHIE